MLRLQIREVCDEGSQSRRPAKKRLNASRTPWTRGLTAWFTNSTSWQERNSARTVVIWRGLPVASVTVVGFPSVYMFRRNTRLRLSSQTSIRVPSSHCHPDIRRQIANYSYLHAIPRKRFAWLGQEDLACEGRIPPPSQIHETSYWSAHSRIR